MKVEREEVLFVPVVITLETQEEVDIFAELAGSIVGAGMARDLTNTLWERLHEYDSAERLDSAPIFSGTLKVNDKS